MAVCPGLYEHYKKKRYRVIGTAMHSETREELVVYQALYGEYGLWVRPAAMFAELVTVDGKEVERFRLLREEPSILPVEGSAVP